MLAFQISLGFKPDLLIASVGTAVFFPELLSIPGDLFVRRGRMSAGGKGWHGFIHNIGDNNDSGMQSLSGASRAGDPVKHCAVHAAADQS